jgi:hypothetical protein
MVTLEVTGVPEVLQRLTALGNALPRELLLAVDTEANAILEASHPLVPVDTGQLVSSGTVRSDAQGSEVRYGNFGAVPYAAIQHFNTDYNHPQGGQAFYLAQPFFAATAGMLERLAAALRS